MNFQKNGIYFRRFEFRQLGRNRIRTLEKLTLLSEDREFKHSSMFGMLQSADRIRAVCYIAYRDRVPIGWCTVQPNELRRSRFFNVYVSKSWRRFRIGQKLLKLSQKMWPDYKNEYVPWNRKGKSFYKSVFKTNED